MPGINSSEKLRIWHVGGRDGFIPLQFPGKFDQNIIFDLFDGDYELIERGLTLLNNRASRAQYNLHKQIFAEKTQIGEFFQTECPYASGINILDKKFKNWTVFGNGNVDYVLGQAHCVVKKSKEEFISMDEFVFSKKNKFLPTIISIDAQGASAKILTGAKNKVIPHCLAVVCEVELIPFFGGLPSFGKILNQLTRQGFYFCRFIPEINSWASPYRRPVEQRSLPLQGSADAIFLKDPRRVINLSSDNIIYYVFTACIFGYLDIATGVIETARSQILPSLNKENKIHNFVFDLYMAMNSCSSHYPVTFEEALKSKNKKNRPLDSDVQIQNETEIEKVLLRWGFNELYEQTRNIRLRQSEYSYSAGIVDAKTNGVNKVKPEPL